jgi:AraC-like DNA-binding protein
LASPGGPFLQCYAPRVTARRLVDWTLLDGARPPTVKAQPRPPAADLSSLLSAFDTLLSPGNTDAILKRAVELCRSRIGLDRAAVFVLDEGARLMLGSWGTGLRGEVVDEHHVMFAYSDGVEDVFRRAESNAEPFTVLDGCPIVVQHRESTEVVRHGWVACTPIRSGRSRIGILFNDAGATDKPLDAGRQAHAALLCSLLGTLIELSRAEPGPKRAAEPRAGSNPLVREALLMLGRDPGLGGKQIAAELGISLSRLVRAFKAEVGLSLVDYRNRLRIERFRVLVDAGERNLHEVAKVAGFGSYAQFHRVFRAVYGTAPSHYLRAR